MDTTWVFPSPLKQLAGRPIATHSLSSRFAALKKEKGWPRDLVLYSARHTFATDLMGATGNVAQTSKMLGHGSLAVTERYLHPKVAKLGMIMDARNASRDEARNVVKAAQNVTAISEAGHDFGHVAKDVQEVAAVSN
jgi:integrase